ncbi:MAG: pyruvate kinase [Acidobacteriota bacterium]
MDERTPEELVPPQEHSAGPVRRTKIVCTLGPASEPPGILEQLVRSGMNVARLNFSHGTRRSHRRAAERLRNLAEAHRRPVALLQDLAGPKVRIGEFRDGQVELVPGHTFVLTPEEVPGDETRVSVSYPRLAEEVKPGDPILLADGAVELRVEEVSGAEVRCRVVTGGVLSSRKGLNCPSGLRRLPVLGIKDRKDLEVGAELGVEYVAVSFVRDAEDIRLVRGVLQQLGSRAAVIAKIETAAAVENFSAILDEADGLMIARGDLSIETPFSRVPVLQKEMIAAANRAAKPVITATQMLFSMVQHPHPTRAEVADIANAVLDGSDAVMLSEETAVGAYPIAALETMAAVALETEQSALYRNRFAATQAPAARDSREAMARAAAELADQLQARYLLTITRSGQMARLASASLPRAPIVAATPIPATYRRLSLIRGVTPLLLSSSDGDYNGLVAESLARIRRWVDDPAEVILLAEDFVRAARLEPE